MTLTAAQYETAKKLLAVPDGPDGLSPDMKNRVQQDVNDYEDSFLKKSAAGEPPLAPGQNYRLITQSSSAPAAPPAEMPMSSGIDPRTGTNDALEGHRLLQMLDPNQPLAPQVLAAQPATNHPLGDQAAKNQWLVGDMSNPKGTTIVYDAPVEVVRQKLLDNPQLFKALGYKVPLTPDKIMQIRQGDSVHQAYNDLYWRLAAADLAEQGKTAYRWNKAPYLATGKNASFLQNLRTKVHGEPDDQQMQALVLGIDKTADFGAGRAALEAANPMVTSPEKPDTMGGAPRTMDLRTSNAIAQEEHPGLYRAGATLAALDGWGPSNWVFNKIYGGVSDALAGDAPGMIRQALASGSGAATGAAALQLGNDAVQAGSQLQQTGRTSETAGGLIGHALTAGAEAGPFGAFLGAAQGAANEIRGGQVYGQLPARAEALGVEPKFGRGFVDPPEVTAARRQALAESKTPQQVIAEKLQQPLSDAANANIAAVEQAGANARQGYYGSAEGKTTPPSTNLVQGTLDSLRGITSPVGQRGISPVARRSAANEVKDVFNQNIEGVSARQGTYGLPISMAEAKAYLNPSWIGKGKGKVDLEGLEKRGVNTLYVTPRRYDAQHFDKMMSELGASSDPDVQSIVAAATKDRAGRSFQGAKGGWQQMHELQAQDEARAQALGAVAKDVPTAYQSVMAASNAKGVATPQVQALQDLAKRAGGSAPQDLNTGRLVDTLDDLQKWGRLGKDRPIGGGLHLPLGLSTIGDAAIMRGVYPVARGVSNNPELTLQLGRLFPSLTGALFDQSERTDMRRMKDKSK